MSGRVYLLTQRGSHGYNRTPGERAAISGRNFISADRTKACHQHRTIATPNGCTGGSEPTGIGLTSPCIRKKNPPKEKNNGYTSHRSGSPAPNALHKPRDPGCTPSVDLNIFPDPVPLILRETTGIPHEGITRGRKSSGAGKRKRRA